MANTCITNEGCRGVCEYAGTVCNDVPDNCPSKCSSDSDCNPSKKCQNGKCIGGGRTPRVAEAINKYIKDHSCKTNKDCKTGQTCMLKKFCI